MTQPTIIYPRRDLARIGPVEASDLKVIQSLPGVHVTGVNVDLPRNLWTLPEVHRWLRDRKLSLQWNGAPPLLPAHGTLRDYQQEACSWILRNEGVVLADQMGLGKTRTAAAAAVAYQAIYGANRPILIIAPRILCEPWRAELLKSGLMQDEEEFHALKGRTLDMAKWRDARFYFVHYEIVDAWMSWLWPLRPAACIVDEAHLLKNSRTRRAKGVALATATAPMKIALTGTPILNRVGEMWNLLNLAQGQWSFGTPLEFRRRYAGAQQGDFGWRDTVPTHQAELTERLRCCYKRRELADVDLQVPPLTRQIVEVEMTGQEAEAYADILGGRDPRDLARAILQSRASQRTLEYLAALRQITSDVKRPDIAELVASIRMQDESVVAFSWERATAARVGKSAHVVHGGLSHAKRDAAITAFQEQGGLLSATFGAMSVGVNLQRASCVVMCDLDYTPATMLQAEARVWRQGQTRPVTSYWVVVKDTLDAFLARHLVRKAETISAVLGGTETETFSDFLGDRLVDVEEQMIDVVRRWQTRT